MGGYTRPIALCTTCNSLIEPVSTHYSKTGNHGELYYCHEHQLSFLVLQTSNSGKRSYYITEPIDILEAAGKDWVWFKKSYPEILEELKQLLQLKKEVRE
jgi:hypothetical protein